MPKHQLTLNGESADVEVSQGPDGLRVRVGDTWHAVDFEPSGRHGLYSLLVDGRSFEVYAQPRLGGWDILIGNEVYPIDHGRPRPGGRQAAVATPAGLWELRSPMAGIVAEVVVSPGDAVRAGETLLVVESMKMNNELRAARDGAVTAVLVRAGERVERGAPLIRIE